MLVDERDFDRAQELYNAFFGSDTTPLTGTTIEEDEATTDTAGGDESEDAETSGASGVS